MGPERKSTQLIGGEPGASGKDFRGRSQSGAVPSLTATN